MKNSIIFLNPSTLPNARVMGYSQIFVVEPVRPNGKPVPDSLAEQMSIVSVNAKAALDAVGASPLIAPDLQVEMELVVRLPD